MSSTLTESFEAEAHPLPKSVFGYGSVGGIELVLPRTAEPKATVHTI